MNLSEGIVSQTSHPEQKHSPRLDKTPRAPEGARSARCERRIEATLKHREDADHPL